MNLTNNFSIIPVTLINLEETINFLLPHEQSCVTLLSRLLLKSENIFTIFHYYQIIEKNKSTNTIRGVIMKSNGGMIQHHINNPDTLLNDKSFASCMKTFFNNVNITCIMGDKQGSLLLLQMVNLFCNNKTISDKIDYLLLTYHPENLPKKFNTLANENKDILFRQCTLSDESNLYELQKEYDIIEVLPSHVEFNESNCKKNLHHLLCSQTFFCAINNNQIIAKANSNAIGKNYIQIGGVFTNSNYRGKGIAPTLVSMLCKYIITQQKKPVLFVKLSNQNAKRAYRKIGFTYKSDYLITYFKDV